MSLGLIALDIDGTLTTGLHSIPDEVVTYLHELYDRGWTIALFTGRTFHWAYSIMRHFTFPYYVAVQNGAIILKMPEQHLVQRHYIAFTELERVEQICACFQTDVVIYAGFEVGDRCFFRPERFSAEQLQYLKKRFQALREDYVAVTSFREISCQQIASLKCFGSEEAMLSLAASVCRLTELDAPVITDRFDPSYRIVQMTRVNKGDALRDCRTFLGVQGPVIAAGDDRNDIDLFHAADLKVVMATAPAEVLSLADVIAPAAKDHGVIQGIKSALLRIA